MELSVATILLVIVGFLCFWHLWTVFSRTGKLVNLIPGPRSLPILGNALDVSVSVGTIIMPAYRKLTFLSDPIPLRTIYALWYVFREWGETYYSIYRFWIGHWPVVNLRHPDDVEVMLGSQKNISKSVFYDFLHPWLEEGLLTSTGSKWRHRRKMLTPAFHYSSLQEFVPVLIENTERMVKSLKSEGGEIVKNVEKLISKYTLNIICETSMGTILRDEDPIQDRYRRSIEKMGEIVYYRSVRPWLRNNWIFSWTQKGKEQKQLLENLHGFTNKIIKERKKYHEETEGKYLIDVSAKDEATPDINVQTDISASKRKRLAMLDLLIAAQKKHADIDDRGIREEVDTFVFEGHDTTQAGLCYTLLLLAEHKEIQVRARVEFDSLMKEHNGKLGMKELQSLSYLDRCIKEAFRMYPPVPVISRKIDEDMQLKKYLIPRGTIVNVHLVDVLRDPKFWPEPHIYNPDRFLPERIDNRHPYSYVPFSAGPRNCIGQKFAMLEAKAIVGMILHNFYLEPVTQLSTVRFASNLILKSVQPLNIKFVHRQ